jgi:hypothetical protein
LGWRKLERRTIKAVEPRWGLKQQESDNSRACSVCVWGKLRTEVVWLPTTTHHATRCGECGAVNRVVPLIGVTGCGWLPNLSLVD